MSRLPNFLPAVADADAEEDLVKILCNALSVTPSITLYHTGPALDHGPLPSLFYFSISGPNSLTLDPFNQPVQFLQGHMIRIFSLDLPGHENGLPATSAMSLWAEDLSSIDTFLDSALLAVDFAIRERFVDPHKLAVAGLSRGAFLAAHLAARENRFRHLLGFAPLTRLGKLKEFQGKDASQYDLKHLASFLSDRHVRLYIGNQDTRVGTRECFDFALSIAEHKKNAQVELIMGPSIGQMGHGTSPDIFKQGSEWIISHLVRV